MNVYIEREIDYCNIPFKAKNTILAGVKSVTLHDDEPTKIADLSSQVIIISVIDRWPLLGAIDYFHIFNIMPY